MKGMPITQKVAKQYASKGVVLYAVNLKEDAKKIRAFLNKQKLKLNVLLDSKGTIAKNYGASSIPMLVLIDKDGTVQKVHIGFSNSLESALKRDLDALVAGKKIAKPAASRGQNQRGGFPGQGGPAGGAGGGFPGQGGAAQNNPQPKPGTPEYAADDFVAKNITRKYKAAAAML